MPTPAERLTLLLPLANADALSADELRDHVFRFLQGFKTGGLRLQSGERELWDAYDAPEVELKAIARKVRLVFTTGFLFDRPGPGTEGITPDDVTLPLTFPSMRFGAFRPTRERKHKQARPDRFTLMVDGWRLRDLVPFLAMWLLTTEDIGISRCTAPAYRNWEEDCGRFFVGSGLGRPRLVCDAKCGSRVKAKARRDKERAEREARKAAQRRKSTQIGRKKR